MFLKGRMSEKKGQDLFLGYLNPALQYFRAGDVQLGGMKPKPFMYKFTKECHIIMVYTPPLDKTNKETASGFEKIFNDVEYFHISRLGFNITKYQYMGSTPQPINAQPMFTLFRKRTKEWLEVVHLYGEKTEDEENNYKKTIQSMNRILKTDPISRWYGAITGDIFNIIRGGRRLAYRLVT